MGAAFWVTAIGLLVACTMQSATGFGFSLIAGPVLFAVIEASAAVTLLMIIGQVVNLLVLFAEQRRPHVDWAVLRPALLAALPGLPIGALIVRVVPLDALRLAVGAIVCGLVISRLVRRRHPSAPRPIGPRGAVVAGLIVGVLTTSTTTTGPPLAIWLTSRRMTPAQIRDAVTVIFLVLDFVALPVFIAVVGLDAGLDHIGWVPLLLPGALVGHFIGRRMFVRIPEQWYGPIVLGFALVAGAISVYAGLA